MKRIHLLPSAFLPLLAACWMDDPATGTNDEVTTSLQMLADNVRSLPGPGEANGVAARSFVSEPAQADMSWNILSMEDMGDWSSWRIMGRTPSLWIDSAAGTSTYTKTTHSNDETTYLESRETYFKDTHGVARLEFAADLVNRGGFRWTHSQSATLDVSGQWGSGVTRTGRIAFPSLGWHCEYSVAEKENALSLATLLASGIPLLDGTNRIGTLRVDTTTGALLWSDLSGRQYDPRPRPFSRNEQDSFGLKISSITREAKNGIDGFRFEGRFRFPTRYGLVADSLRIFHSTDSLKFPGSQPALAMGAPDGVFSFFEPATGFGEVTPSWVRFAMTLKSLDPSSSPQVVSSPIIALP